MLREYWAHVTCVSQLSGNKVVCFEDSRGSQQRSEHSTHLHKHIISPGPGTASGVMRLIDELSEHADSLLRLLVWSARLGHLGVDALAEPLVPCQSEDVVDLIGLTPTHQIVSAEAGEGKPQFVNDIDVCENHRPSNSKTRAQGLL